MSSIVSRKSWHEDKNNNFENSTDLRVIGVGLPRTGTTSLKAALEILGFGPCHHMIELFEKPNRTIEFTRAYDGENIDFHELMKGYGSTVDVPTVDFYKEIHQAYPQAKLILTVRDSDEKWFQSYQNTIEPVVTSKLHYFCIYLLRVLRLQHRLSRKSLEKWIREYDEITPSMHSKHNKRMINENQADEMLVFNVKEGWTPLCKFLNVNIPEDIPFPNINDTKEFNSNVKFGKIIGLCAWAGVGGLFIISSYLVMKMI